MLEPVLEYRYVVNIDKSVVKYSPVRITQRNEAELGCRIDYKVLSHAANMSHG